MTRHMKDGEMGIGGFRRYLTAIRGAAVDCDAYTYILDDTMTASSSH